MVLQVTLSVLKSVLSMGTIPIVFVQLGAANQAVADFVNANNLSDKVLIEDNFGYWRREEADIGFVAD